MKIPDNPMTIEDKLNWAVHNIELEGYTVPEEAKEIYKLILENKITDAEAMKKLNALAKEMSNHGR